MFGTQLVIDGDGHFVEPPAVWSKYLAPEYRGRILLRTESAAGASEQSPRPWTLGREAPTESDGDVVERFVLDGFETYLTAPSMPFTVSDTMHPHGILPGRARRLPFAECHPGGFSGDARLAVHDAEGIDAAVLFPTLGLFIGSIREGPLALAFAQAVNRFLADYCSAAPDELFGVATLPTQDPELAATELRRCVTTHGFVAGWLRPNPTYETNRTLGDPSLEVLWSTAEELNVPLCIHSGTTGREPTAGMDRARSFLLGHAVAHPFEAMLAFGTLFQAQVFERHPRLRVGFMESNSGWAPFWLDRLDEHCETMGWMFDPPLKRSATQTFLEHCVIGSETEERMVPYVQSRLSDEHVLWASDFPHFDCEMPGLVAPVMKRGDLSVAQRDGVLRRGALRFYGLPEARIRQSIARRRQSTRAAGRVTVR